LRPEYEEGIAKLKSEHPSVWAELEEFHTQAKEGRFGPDLAPGLLDEIAVKFLRARGLNVEQAATMAQNFCKWWRTSEPVHPLPPVVRCVGIDLPDSQGEPRDPQKDAVFQRIAKQYLLCIHKTDNEGMVGGVRLAQPRRAPGGLRENGQDEPTCDHGDSVRGTTHGHAHPRHGAPEDHS